MIVSAMPNINKLIKNLAVFFAVYIPFSMIRYYYSAGTLNGYLDNSFFKALILFAIILLVVTFIFTAILSRKNANK